MPNLETIAPPSLRTAILSLPSAQRRVVRALLAGEGQTYPQVGVSLKISRGTVSRYLRRIRILRLSIYAAILAYRGLQLRERHARALARAETRSQLWHQAVARRRRRQEPQGRPHGKYGTIFD